MTAFNLYVLIYDLTKWSALALEAEYGELGSYLESSLDLPVFISPYTSSVDI